MIVTIDILDYNQIYDKTIYTLANKLLLNFDLVSILNATSCNILALVKLLIASMVSHSFIYFLIYMYLFIYLIRRLFMTPV